MKLIKNNDAFKKSNGDKCDVFEYSFDDKEIDLGVAIIKGRYPEQGFCMNLVSKELIYVIEGTGVLYFEDGSIEFSKGDSILINNNEKYYWISEYCKVSITCTPAWNKEQYQLIK